MQFKTSFANPCTQKTQCLVVPITNRKKLAGVAAQVNEQCTGIVGTLLKQGDLPESIGATLPIVNVDGIPAKRILLLNATSSGSPLTPDAYQKLCNHLVSALKKLGANDALLCITEIEVTGRDLSWKANTLAQAAVAAEYRFDQHKSKTSQVPTVAEKLTLQLADRKSVKAAETGLAQGKAIGAGLSVAKDLGNLAPNVCTPRYLARYATDMRKQWKSLKVSVMDEAQMAKHKMGALLSVSAGSKEPAKLISMQYNGATASKKPIVLVGKGITFDTGGISLKPGAGMDEMKFDMCGAASVFGVMRAIVELKLPINVVGMVAAAENMPDAEATRPGDIVTTMSGQTVEILNTDAEGRLVLCDALTYCSRFKPDVVIDIATLTGACIIALGNDVSAMMSNDDDLADDLYAAGNATADKCWRLPIWDEYQNLLKSNFADIPNIAGRAAGSITAGCFLSRFCKDYRWAHLDIAGVAWKQGGAKGATGRPVNLLTQYIIDRC